MEKKRYVSPRVETVQLAAQSILAQSLNATGLGDDFKGYGGKASEHYIHQADANRNNGWDLW